MGTRKPNQPSVVSNFLSNSTWSLRFFRSDNLDGSTDFPMGENPFGLLIYGSSGHMSVQMARSDRDDRTKLPFASDDVLNVVPDDAKRAMDTYLAYCGTYSVDQDAGTVTHAIESCTYPLWIGVKQVRSFHLEGDILTLKTAKPALFHGKLRIGHLEWERAR
ncbi:MAG: lipocalin-like domain-containing protein [Verrucomicrobiota bacterium]